MDGRTRSAHPSGRRGGASPRRALLLLGIAVALVGGAGLLILRAAEWLSGRPVAVLVTAAAAVPVVVVLIRGMPRKRELRRAARAGMADADAEALAHRADERRRSTPAPDPRGAPGHRDARGRAPATGGSSGIELFRSMAADEFEQAVAGLCERDGCREVRVAGGSGDLGADVVATAPDGRRIVIQCKRYGEGNKVGSQDVQRFGGTCYTVHGAEVAAIVTTSGFTAPAADFAASTGILCFDETDLADWADGSGPAPWAP